MKLNARHKIGLQLAKGLPPPWSWKLLKIPARYVSTADCAAVFPKVKEDLSTLIPHEVGPFGEFIDGSVFSIRHGYSTHWGANLTARGELIADLSRQGYGTGKPHFSFGKPRLRRSRRIRGTVATLTIEHRSNYFHFLADSVSRLQLIQNLERRPDYLYIQHNQKYQRAILARMGYQPEQIIDSSVHPFIQADELLIPSYVSVMGRFTENSVSFLGSQIKKARIAPPAAPGRVVYISRKDSPKRQLLNEDELLDRLSAFGVESVLLSKQSMDQNIEMFGTADVIIAQWGAGLADLIFARRQLFLILLMPPVWKGISILIEPFGIEYREIMTSTFPAEADPYAPSTWHLTEPEIQAIAEVLAGRKKSNPMPSPA